MLTLTQAADIERPLSPILASTCEAVLTRADGRRVDTRILWAPALPSLDSALTLALALLASDGAVTIKL